MSKTKKWIIAESKKQFKQLLREAFIATNIGGYDTLLALNPTPEQRIGYDQAVSEDVDKVVDYLWKSSCNDELVIAWKSEQK